MVDCFELFFFAFCFCVAATADEAIRDERQKRQIPIAAGAIASQSTVTINKGVCPGGPSMGRECDAKRPWPQCPPQSYCYAVNSVDIGPYYCCPVWSTYGAAWRPQTWFYPYYPPNPYPFPWPIGVQPAAPVAIPAGPIPEAQPIAIQTAGIFGRKIKVVRNS